MFREEFDINFRFYSAPKRLVRKIGRRKIQYLVKRLLDIVKEKGELVEKKIDSDLIIETYRLDFLDIEITCKRYVFKILRNKANTT